MHNLNPVSGTQQTGPCVSQMPALRDPDGHVLPARLVPTEDAGSSLAAEPCWGWRERPVCRAEGQCPAARSPAAWKNNVCLRFVHTRGRGERRLRQNVDNWETQRRAGEIPVGFPRLLCKIRLSQSGKALRHPSCSNRPSGPGPLLGLGSLERPMSPALEPALDAGCQAHGSVPTHLSTGPRGPPAATAETKRPPWHRETRSGCRLGPRHLRAPPAPSCGAATFTASCPAAHAAASFISLRASQKVFLKVLPLQTKPQKPLLLL